MLRRMSPRLRIALALSLATSVTSVSADPRQRDAAPGFFGAQLDAQRGGGIRIRALVGGGPAANAGLREGDVIVLARGLPPGDAEGFTRSVRAAGAGTRYPVTVRRGAQRLSLEVTLAGMPSAGAGVSVGSIPPALTGATRISGTDPVDLGSLRGRVVLLDFWASWCGPCQMMMPALNRIAEQYRAQGLSVIGLTDDPPDVVRRVGARMRIRYTLASSPGAMASYGVRSLPTLVMIDRGGRVRSLSVGFESASALDRAVRALLAEQTRP